MGYFNEIDTTYVDILLMDYIICIYIYQETHILDPIGGITELARPGFSIKT